MGRCGVGGLGGEVWGRGAGVGRCEVGGLGWGGVIDISVEGMPMSYDLH